MTAFAWCISALDRGFLAGFLEGEACLTITEQNGGQSYGCRMGLRLRDDDQDVLEWLVALTGLGRLGRVPAQRTSRPQIAWTIDSQGDCAALLHLLTGCGFHGRRAAELRLWSEAVEIWSRTGGEARRAALRTLKSRLAAARKYGLGAASARPFAGSDRQTLGYISGLVCAEGCFQFGRHRPRFAMHLRHDDRPLLEGLRSTTGLGSIHDYDPGRPLNPSSSWVVAARDELEQLTRMFYSAGLAGRKGVEFETWAVAVHELCSSAKLGVRPRETMLRLAADRLRAMREYQPSTRALLQLSRRDVRAESLTALKNWSEQTAGRLACGLYARWRRDHPAAPTRNTVAKEFGTWHAALEAAGLVDRAARGPKRAGGDAERREHRNLNSARVLAAVQRLEAELGRPPRAMEFFKWRMAVAPDTPSQASVYKLFPGGWDAVLAACRD